jgi:AcrR family transcriptional regulator
MAARKVIEDAPTKALRQRRGEGAAGAERYQRLPTGTHGLDPELVKRDQRRRLREALVELIAARGYPGVRIADLARLAHVSAPTFYGLYANKEELFVDAYDEITQQTAVTVLGAYATDKPATERLADAVLAFAELAAAEPQRISLLVLGAFGAGPEALERRRRNLAALEHSIQSSRDGEDPGARAGADFIVKAILGGIREVTAARLGSGRHEELAALAPELAAWASCYPRHLPQEIVPPVPGEQTAHAELPLPPSERARRAEGPLPSGRSELPRQTIEKSQRERIVDATAAIVAEKGLAGLTIPEIVRRANISNQTFYAIYSSKRDAFLGAQKVGMHQALQVTVRAYEEQRADWPRAVAAGLKALLCYLASEPAHARLTLVDTFGASPQAMEIRGDALAAFAAYLRPGYELVSEGMAVPGLAAEAIAGGIWQTLHHYIEHAWTGELPGLAGQLTYFALRPFLGHQAALDVARSSA